MYIDPWGLAGQQSWLDSARETFLASDAFQFTAGVLSGGLAGAAPGGFILTGGLEAGGGFENHPRSYRMGLGLGEAAWGVAQIIGGGALAGGGGTLAAGGGAASSTGIGAVVGAPAMALGVGAVGTGAAVMAEGGPDVATGFGVFMSAWSERPGTSGGYGDVVESGDTPLIITPRHGLLRSAPKHHVFPQEFRKWFHDRGIDVDDYTVVLSEGDHAAIHFGGGKGKGGGWWNQEMMKLLTDAESDLGRRLTPDEILILGRQLLDRAGLGSPPFVRY
jgi:hypothetical protein